MHPHRGLTLCCVHVWAPDFGQCTVSRCEGSAGLGMCVADWLCPPGLGGSNMSQLLP